jgi:hypothetical protein
LREPSQTGFLYLSAIAANWPVAVAGLFDFR